MGFTSWTCKCCGKSALSPEATSKGINEWMSKVVVLDAEDFISGTYNGYGEVNGCEIHEHFSKPAVYHRACWEQAGRPDYDGPSPYADDQGWFFNEKDYDILEPGKDHPPGYLITMQAKREQRRRDRKLYDEVDVLDLRRRRVKYNDPDGPLVWQDVFSVYEGSKRTTVYNRITDEDEFGGAFDSLQEAEAFCRAAFDDLIAREPEIRAAVKLRREENRTERFLKFCEGGGGGRSAFVPFRIYTPGSRVNLKDKTTGEYIRGRLEPNQWVVLPDRSVEGLDWFTFDLQRFSSTEEVQAFLFKKTDEFKAHVADFRERVAQANARKEAELSEIIEELKTTH